VRPTEYSRIGVHESTYHDRNSTMAGPQLTSDVRRRFSSRAVDNILCDNVMSSSAASSPQRPTKPSLPQEVVPNPKLGRGKQRRPSADKIALKGCTAREQATGGCAYTGARLTTTDYRSWGLLRSSVSGRWSQRRGRPLRTLLRGIYWEQTCRTLLLTSIERR
jgi:hypothetical protein